MQLGAPNMGISTYLRSPEHGVRRNLGIEDDSKSQIRDLKALMSTFMACKRLLKPIRPSSSAYRFLSSTSMTANHPTRAPQYRDWLEWCKTQSINPSDLAPFRSTPWTARWLSDPNFRTAPTPSRLPDPGTSNNSFFAKTLAQSTTIPHWVLLLRQNLYTPSDSSKGTIASLSTSTTSASSSRPTADADCLLLLDLGSDIDGFGGVCHGGALCAIMDEMLSLVVEFHRQSVTKERGPLFTVRLTTTFRGPVPTPGLVLVKAWLEVREGRKWWLRGQVCDETETVLTEAEGIWVSAKEERL